jgi:lipopolysaccharide export system permease protein
MIFSRIVRSRFLVPAGLAALGALSCAFLIPGEITSVQQQLKGFPDSDVLAHQARPLILAALCFLPAITGFLYTLGGTMDRYIARQFTGSFSLCFGALLTIWFLMDFADKIGDFQDSSHVLQTVMTFYSTRLPAVFLLLMPYSLLLSLLYSMGKLSSSREIIAMVQAGRSIARITRPLIIAGLLLSALAAGLNFHWAPNAEGRQNEILAEATGKIVTQATNVIFRNPSDRRLWMIGAFPQDYEKGAPLLDVEITITREDKTLQSRISTPMASWDPTNHHWTLQNPIIRTYQPGQAPTIDAKSEPLVLDSWPETPWQLIKPGLSPAFLGIPDLNSWIRENLKNGNFANPSPYLTHWHYRWALAFTCLVTVLLATPLGIHFSRRGPRGGVFVAVILSALMLLISNISIALGESGTLRPALAAWLPNLAFTLLGIYLFQQRISNGSFLQRWLKSPQKATPT